MFCIVPALGTEYYGLRNEPGTAAKANASGTGPPDADAGRHVHVVKLVEDDRLVLQDVVVVIVVVVIVVGDAGGQLDDDVHEQHDGGDEAEGAVQRRVAVHARFRGHFVLRICSIDVAVRSLTSHLIETHYRVV